MKRSRKNRFNGLSVFAGDRPESYDALLERAEQKIDHIKEAYGGGGHISFEYDGEVIRGAFVDVVPGEFPGTFMIVLRIPSSRLCTGPCFLRLLDEHLGGIAVTANSGLVGITAKALPVPATALLDNEETLAHCA